MPVESRYKDFGSKMRSGQIEEIHEAEPLPAHEDHLASFEAGYQAGWDDAIAAEKTTSLKIEADIAQKIQEISFTYQEACNSLALKFKPVLFEIINKTLPEILEKSIWVHIHQLVDEVAGGVVDKDLQILLGVGNEFDLAERLRSTISAPVEILSDAALDPGTIIVRISGEETQIDVSSICKATGEAVEAFFFHIGEGKSHD